MRKHYLGRRSFLALASAAIATSALGHTPYRQWNVYRQRHLLIGTSRVDEPTYELGKQIVQILQAKLPSSSARVTRARTVYRLASLISTKQLQVVLLSASDTLQLANGEGPFTEFGGLSLRKLIRLGHHCLVVRDDFPDHHAWQIATTLADNQQRLPGVSTAVDQDPVPLHRGASLAFRGSPAPRSESRRESGPGAHAH